MTLKQLGKTVQYLRKQEGFSHEAFAKKTNISLPTLERLELGRHNPDFSTLTSLARVLKLPLTALLVPAWRTDKKRTLYMAKNREALKLRFARHVTRLTAGCWEWTGRREKTGYGRFGVFPSIPDYSHRVAYELYRGPIPYAHVIDHTCRKPFCVNPDHLRVVLQGGNLARRKERRRANLKRKQKGATD